MSQRLYMAVWVQDESAEHEECYHDDIECSCFVPEPDPEGWVEFALANDIVDENGVARRFFWPKTNVPYKARSSAQARVNAINRWGGRAVVMECTPVWETVEAANARRRIERLESRRDRIEAELSAVEEEIAEEELTIILNKAVA